MAEGEPSPESNLAHISGGVMITMRLIAAAEKLGPWAFGSWVAVEAVYALAGTDTLVNLTAWIAFETGDKPWEVIAYTVLIIWASSERIFRQRKTEELQGRIRGLEKRHDPQRESSNLTAQGRTNPQDRI